MVDVRALAYVVFAYLAFSLSEARAANPCPYISFGWGQQWTTGTLQSASYDQVAQVLYVVFRDQTIQAFNNVPIGVIRSFTQTPNPYQFYQTSVLRRYPRIVLTERENCPLIGTAQGADICAIGSFVIGTCSIGGRFQDDGSNFYIYMQ